MNSQSRLTPQQVAKYCLSLEQQGNAAQAIAIIEQAIAQAPQAPLLRDVATHLYVNHHNRDAAIKHATARVRLKADDSGYQNLALCIRSFGHYSEGVKILEGLEREYPSHTASAELFAMKLTAGEILDTEEILTGINKLKATRKAPFFLQALIDSGKLDALKAAAIAGEAVLAHNDNDPDLLVCLSSAYIRIDSGKALHFAEQVLALDAENFNGKANQAIAMGALGDRATAIEDLYALLKEDPEHIPVRKNVSQFLFAEGRFKEASKNYISDPDTTISFNGKSARCPTNKKELKKYLVHMDQGVGDQIRHSLLLKWLSDARVYTQVLVESRLERFLKRIAPGHRYITNPSGIANHEINQVCYASQLTSLFDQQLAANHQSKQQGKPLTKGWYHSCQRKQKKEQGKFRLGIAWRSVKPLADRVTWYPTLSELTQMLANINAELVVLNQNLSDEELSFLSSLEQTMTTVDEMGIDAKDDFNAMSDLLESLDGALLPPTALVDQAGVVGLPTVLLGAEGGGRWFLSEKYLATFYGNLTYFRKTDSEDWGPQISAVNDLLQSWTDSSPH